MAQAKQDQALCKYLKIFDKETLVYQLICHKKYTGKTSIVKTFLSISRIKIIL